MRRPAEWLEAGARCGLMALGFTLCFLPLTGFAAVKTLKEVRLALKLDPPRSLVITRSSAKEGLCTLVFSLRDQKKEVARWTSSMLAVPDGALTREAGDPKHPAKVLLWTYAPKTAPAPASVSSGNYILVCEALKVPAEGQAFLFHTSHVVEEEGLPANVYEAVWCTADKLRGIWNGYDNATGWDSSEVQVLDADHDGQDEVQVTGGSFAYNDTAEYLGEREGVLEKRIALFKWSPKTLRLELGPNQAQEGPKD